jgi:tetratricopeptide (TPR) repeat protein
MITNAIYQEASCYLLMKKYEKSFTIVMKLMDYIGKLQDDDYKAEIYNLVAILSIKVGNDKFQEYEKYSFEFCRDNLREKTIFLYRYGSAMIGTNNNDKAYEYIIKAMKLFPDGDKFAYVNFMIDVIQTLIDMGKMEEAGALSDKILNYSIDLRNDIFIEKAYYFKAITIGSMEKFQNVEMYMNLSLDILLKIGTRKQIYKRYLELGNLYFKNNNTSESLKYFSFAINLSKKL